MPVPAKRSKRARIPSSPLILRNTTLSQWGNSLGLRIPQEAADHFKLKPGASVRIEVNSHSITIRPARKRWSERELLKGVTPDAAGAEIDWGPPRGREIW